MLKYCAQKNINCEYANDTTGCNATACRAQPATDNNYELNAIREAYRAIKKLCYECEQDCEHCRVGEIREDIVQLERYYLDINRGEKLDALLLSKRNQV